MLIEKCLCGGSNFSQTTIHKIPCNVCNHCGVTHQRVEKTVDEYFSWYADRFMEYTYDHTYEQDRKAAISRLGLYESKLGDRVLDFGSGNGAFLDACVQRGIETFGLDLHAPEEHPYYNQPLEDVKFPSGYFSSVVANDVIEHLVDPKRTLQELARIIEDGGRLIIDFPDFFKPTSVRHWRELQHIWFLTFDKLKQIVEQAGFTLEFWNEPVPEKFTLIFTKDYKKRTTILLPPGIGDTYWCLTKLEGMCRREGIIEPEIYIASTMAARDRSADFVRRFPFLHFGSYFHEGRSLKEHPIWKKAYHGNGDGIFKNVFGFDYFLSANGPFRYDKTLDDIMPQWETNWYPDMFISSHERDVARDFSSDKPYIVVFFTSSGPYKRWFAEYPPEAIIKHLKNFALSGYRVVFTGAAWDAGDSVYKEIVDSCDTPAFENLIGQTTLEELMGLLRGCSGVFGHAAGNTIMGTVLKKPTVILWNDYFNTLFHTASCPPDSLHNWYEAVNTKDCSTNSPLKLLHRMIKDNE